MSPFDAARYARLLEGLEATEVLLSYANANNDIVRIDSEYFKKQHLQDEARRRSRAYRRLVEMGAQVRSFGAYSLNNEVEYVSAGVPFVRGVNMKKGRVSFSDMQYIRPEAHRLLWKSEVKEGMVLLSMSGTIGDVAIATASWPYPVNSNQDIAKIETRGACSPFVLYAFLLSRYGQGYLKREARGSVQQHVFLSQIDQLEVPDFDALFSRRLQEVIEDSERHELSAESQQRRAQEALLYALGLNAWNAPEPLSYVRRSSEAFASGRLDAQFFSPRVQSLMALLGRDRLTVATVAPPRHDEFDPEKAGPTFQYIEIGDVCADATVSSSELPTVEAPSRATQHVKAGDVITSTVRPIRRLSAIVDATQDGAVCSSGFVVLNPTEISSATLVTYLRLPPVCELMDLHCSASLYPAISEKDLLGLPIPKIGQDVQQSVDASLHAARTSKAKARRLLDAAKRAVEIAIEDSEAAALAYLNKIAPRPH